MPVAEHANTPTAIALPVVAAERTDTSVCASTTMRVSQPLNGQPPARATLTDQVLQLGHQGKIALGALTQDRAYTGPLYVQVGVVNACNSRCQFCWDHPSFVSKDSPYPDAIAEDYYQQHPELDRNKAHMSWEMYTGLVDDLHDLGTRKLKFIGRGENFLHKQFVPMVAYARGRKFN